MASVPIAPGTGQFQHALTVYNTARSIRRPGMTDDETDAAELIIEPTFATVIKSRAFSPGEVAAKGEAILHEYGEGEIPACLVRVMVDDLRGMVQ